MGEHTRNNHTLENIVQLGIAEDALRGSVSAWVFMNDWGVPRPVILRVLVDPSRRRQSDTQGRNREQVQATLPSSS